MTTYIAFLRGINVGGHRVKMDRLRELFRELNLDNVRTYIQSGNVFFDTSRTDRDALTTQIECHLCEALGYEVPVFLRTTTELEQTLQLEPFKDVEVTPDIRLLMMFTREPLHTKGSLPLLSPKNDMEILSMTSGEVFLVMHLVNGKWGNLTGFMKQAFKVNPIVTTRFYDTTIKILQAAQSP
ncbi:hypothetical protein IAD21_02871 [Abditibacteriota bacterium]|nr:hypothetical protein IAD21_02871 [Abditibacteriota bacterium]